MKKLKIIPLILITPLFASLGKENNVALIDSLNPQITEINSYKTTSLLKTHFTPSDPFYTGASKVNSPRGAVYQNISYSLIGNIEHVWDSYKGKGITIAVIDTGADINHPDFEGKISELSGYFYLDGNTPKQKIGLEYLAHDKTATSYSNHGTSTAATALAGSGTSGTIGIAPEATLLALKCDLQDLSVNAAIEYAVDNGADVINLSIGAHAEKYYDHRENKWYDKLYTDYFPGCDKSMQKAIDYAYEHNVIVLASAGNEATEGYSYPAANNHVVAVGALEYCSSTHKADFSNYNKDTDKEGDNCNVDLVAPGYVVTASYNGSSTYVQTQGTSFSSPIVAGAAALWKEKNPNGSPDDFMQDLKASCNDLGETGWDATFGYGSLNIGQLMSLMAIDTTPIKIEEGKTYQIKISSQSGLEELSFASENNSIATVNNSGLVTAIKAGITNIIVTSNGTTRTIHVTVLSNSNPLVTGFGCSGNISTTSMVISLLSIAFVSLLLTKKYILKK